MSYGVLASCLLLMCRLQYNWWGAQRLTGALPPVNRWSILGPFTRWLASCNFISKGRAGLAVAFSLPGVHSSPTVLFLACCAAPWCQFHVVPEPQISACSAFPCHCLFYFPPGDALDKKRAPSRGEAYIQRDARSFCSLPLKKYMPPSL